MMPTASSVAAPAAPGSIIRLAMPRSAHAPGVVAPPRPGAPTGSSLLPEKLVCRPPGCRSRRPRHREVWQLALPQASSFVSLLADEVPERVASMGHLGPLYFFCVYMLAQCVALPATPLSLTAGYLFGAPFGAIIAIAAGSAAASVCFVLSRSLLRPQLVARFAARSPLYKAINVAAQREGFKIVALLRLSPMVPFSASSYMCGLSGVDFADFWLGSVVGFAPGTCLYARIGTAARDALRAGGFHRPWYAYVGAAAATVLLLWLATEVGRRAVAEATDGAELGERSSCAATDATAAAALPFRRSRSAAPVAKLRAAIFPRWAPLSALRRARRTGREVP